MSGAECDHCTGLGVVRAIPTDNSVETLMNCDCAAGKIQDYAIPRWEWRHGQLFRRGPCPLSWFKPEVGETIQHKTEYWKAKIRIAEGYWDQVQKEILAQQK